MASDAPKGRMADVTVVLRQAVGALATDPARAEALARDVVETIPAHPDALIVMATAMRLQGAFEAALGVLAPVAAQQSTSWIAHFELAQVLFALGRSRAAIAPLSEAVKLNPDLAAGWRLLGDILMFSGQFGPAQAAYDQRLRSVLRDRRLRDIVEAMAEGRLEGAERALASLLAGSAAPAVARHLLGEVLGRSGRLARAEEILATLIAEAPDLDLARQSYASVLMGAGKHELAVGQLDRLLARDPGDHRCSMMKAAALTEMGDYAGAAEATAGLLKLFPDQPHGWLVHGAGLRTLGRIDEAVAAWRRCIELDSNFSEAYWSLANLKTYRFLPAALSEMEARLASAGLETADRINLHFALGKAQEDARRYEPAFDHYARGNAIAHALGHYDPAATSALVRRSKALFTAEFYAERASWGCESRDPIFIVGMPRSGSTLVDQILSSHPAVEGLGERLEIRMIADWVGGASPAERRSGYPDRIRHLSQEMCAKLGRDYLEWTSARRKLGRDRFTDKAPWNFLHAGLIHLILPNARIVDVRRHPLGCCLSAFRQRFAQGWDFSYDLSDLGRYYADYADLMAHFDAAAPGAAHRVIYESLIEDTPGEIRRLLAFLDLPYDPACLRYFDNPRPVATPSSEQVRQPIFADAVDQWRRFEPWLGPLKTALGPVLDTWRSPTPAQA